MNMMQAFAQFIQNPGAFFQQRGLQMPPQSALQSPQGMIQYFMNSGSITQQQYNQAAEKAKQLQSDPQFMQMMQGMFRR
ncbi:MAG: hypothetical protein J6S92_13705 [Oscillospiraceae bacterium]|nr:hypothetical protein [Oscillospiraceae bacterium]MBP0989313.1 hypothetical protein [Oscillospiraceae bacterium]MBQ5339841.1 hypothetical protein [Oscillospiraceae bacterium]